MISCRIIRALFCLSLCGYALCGCKDDKLEIPRQLSGTSWAVYATDGPNYELTFDEKECELTTIVKTEDEKEDVSIKVYRYSYSRPSVMLTSIEDENEKLTGEVSTDGSSYIVMSLNNEDYSWSTSFWKLKL